ncbi:MAG: flippase-like domain-containing protein [Saprospiraceae bacterium]|nr:flippase-like domain-containing protein [Saprospiraceae bacterium]
MPDTAGKPYQFNLNKTINRLVVVVSVGIIAHLIFLLLTNEKNIFQYLSQIKLPYVFLILVLLSMNWIGHGLRIVIWTHYLKQRLKFLTGVKIAIYTELGQAITPTLIGGGPIKLALFIRNGLSTGKAGFLTLLGGVEDFIMYSSVFIISCFYARDAVFQIGEAISLFVVEKWDLILLVIIGIFILRIIFKKLNWSIVPRKYNQAWENLMLELKSGWQEMIYTFGKVIRNGFGYFILSFSILIFQWTSRFTVLIVLLYALGVDFEPVQIYLQQWIVYLTMIFIPTPGATGGAEATFFLLFDGEIPKDLLPLIVSTWRFFIYYLMLFTAVTLVQVFHFSKKKRQPSTIDNE